MIKNLVALFKPKPAPARRTVSPDPATLAEGYSIHAPPSASPKPKPTEAEKKLKEIARRTVSFTDSSTSVEDICKYILKPHGIRASTLLPYLHSGSAAQIKVQLIIDAELSEAARAEAEFQKEEKELKARDRFILE